MSSITTDMRVKNTRTQLYNVSARTRAAPRRARVAYPRAQCERAFRHTRSVGGLFFLRSSDLLLVDFGQIVDELVAAGQLSELLPQLVLRLQQLFNVLLLHLQLHRRFTDLHKNYTCTNTYHFFYSCFVLHF